MDLAKIDREGPFATVEMMAHGVGQFMDPRFDFARADDLDRMASLVDIERTVEQGRDSTEMVAVEMGDQDHVDLVPGDSELRETCIRGRAAIEEHASAFAARKDR